MGGPASAHGETARSTDAPGVSSETALAGPVGHPAYHAGRPPPRCPAEDGPRSPSPCGRPRRDTPQVARAPTASRTKTDRRPRCYVSVPVPLLRLRKQAICRRSGAQRGDATRQRRKPHQKLLAERVHSEQHHQHDRRDQDSVLRDVLTQVSGREVGPRSTSQSVGLLATDLAWARGRKARSYESGRLYSWAPARHSK